MDAPDLLGVLSSTRAVVEEAKHVRIDWAKVEAVADELVTTLGDPPAWDASLHYRDGTWRTAGWVLALDALNFCFWGETPDPAARWKVRFRGKVHDGYWALAAALIRAVEEGRPLWDHHYLATLTADELQEMLRPVPGAPPIPLFEARLANLRELGQGLQVWEDAASDRAPVVALIAEADRSAVRLVRSVVEAFPSFDDVAVYRGQEVRFYKRAQILVADLVGAFDGRGLGEFDDLDALTAFADYKVPQVLRRLGLLVYDGDLAARIDRYELLPAGSPAEIEIRAATIWACEELRRALTARGHALRAFEVDWALWTAGQDLPADAHPYHRTRTIYY